MTSFIDFTGTFLLHSTIGYGIVLGLLALAGKKLNPSSSVLFLKGAMVLVLVSSIIASFQPDLGARDLSSIYLEMPMQVDSSFPLGIKILIGTYASIAFGLFLRTVFNHFLFIKKLTHRQTVPVEKWGSDWVLEVCRRNQISISEFPFLASPCILSRSEICVPTDREISVTQTERNSILAHEIGHIIYRDALWLRMIAVCNSLFFFQPLQWMISSKLHLAMESRCDVFASAQTSPIDMARGLIAMAQNTSELKSAIVPSLGTSLSSRITCLKNLHSAKSYLSGVYLSLFLIGFILWMAPAVLGTQELSFGNPWVVHFDEPPHSGEHLKLHVSGKGRDQIEGTPVHFEFNDTKIDTRHPDIVRLPKSSSFSMDFQEGEVQHRFQINRNWLGRLSQSQYQNGERVPFNSVQFKKAALTAFFDSP